MPTVSLTTDEAAQQLIRKGLSWSASLGQAATVTYAFRATEPAEMPDGTSGFVRFSVEQIALAERALMAWSDVANITFVRVGSGATGEQAFSDDATILFGNFTTGPEGFTAFGFFPGPTDPQSPAGDIWHSVDWALNGHLHENGHAIGLSHPSNYNGGIPSYDTDASYIEDSQQYTVMSYFPGSATGASVGVRPGGPQMHDIAAAQLLYGANYSTRSGTTVYGFHSNTNRDYMTIKDAATPVNFCIWDGGGNDTLDLSGYSTDSVIDLRPESFSSAGPGDPAISAIARYNISIAAGAIIENAVGGSGADTLTGNGVANVLTGNAGADTLDGGSGMDRLDGGDGDDTIFWDAGDDLVNVLGGAGSDLLVFTSGAAPTSFNLTSHGFETAEGRFTDAGGNPWATRTELYDALWRADFTTIVNDDGSRETTDYDPMSCIDSPRRHRSQISARCAAE